jgi:hypothetical protein
MDKTTAIRFEAKVFTIGDHTLLRLPPDASAKLPSRGLTMVQGTINGFGFQAPLEPDGKKSHWLELDKPLLNGAGVHVGDTAQLAVEASKEWPEPKVPEDLQKALDADPAAHATWDDITPMARWDWIRWIRSTKNPATRARRIEVTFSKFQSRKRRPCCFNRTECTDPEVSSNGVLLEAQDGQLVET